MMYPVIRRLLHKRVVLASASPRRQEILSNAVSGRGPGALWPRVSWAAGLPPGRAWVLGWGLCPGWTRGLGSVKGTATEA